MLSSSKTTSKLNVKTESDSAWVGLLGSLFNSGPTLPGSLPAK